MFSIYMFNDSDIDRIIEMAWEYRTQFEAISYQFGRDFSLPIS